MLTTELGDYKGIYKRLVILLFKYLFTSLCGKNVSEKICYSSKDYSNINKLMLF